MFNLKENLIDGVSENLINRAQVNARLEQKNEILKELSRYIDNRFAKLKEEGTQLDEYKYSENLGRLNEISALIDFTQVLSSK